MGFKSAFINAMRLFFYSDIILTVPRDICAGVAALDNLHIAKTCVQDWTVKFDVIRIVFGSRL